MFEGELVEVLAGQAAGGEGLDAGGKALHVAPGFPRREGRGGQVLHARRLHADLTCYTGRAGRRQVDPGEVELRVGRSSADIEVTLGYTLTGPRREVGFDRVLHPEITLLPAD